MFDTLIALLTAHLLADFVFQTDWIVRHKKNFAVFLLHGVTVLALTSLVPGTLNPWLLGTITLTHLVMDWVKTNILPSGLGSFVADQLVHVGVIVVVAYLWPDAMAQGWLAYVPAELAHYAVGGLILISAIIAATKMGAVVVAQLLEPYEIEVKEADPARQPPVAVSDDPDDLAKAAAEAARRWAAAAEDQAKRAGAAADKAEREAERASPEAEAPKQAEKTATTRKRSISDHVMIGVIERLIVLMLVLAGEFTAVGFLITAKSILRFSDLDTTYKRKMTEFIIVGTMASFGWAIFVGLVAQSALSGYGLAFDLPHTP